MLSIFKLLKKNSNNDLLKVVPSNNNEIVVTNDTKKIDTNDIENGVSSNDNDLSKKTTDSEEVEYLEYLESFDDLVDYETTAGVKLICILLVFIQFLAYISLYIEVGVPDEKEETNYTVNLSCYYSIILSIVICANVFKKAFIKLITILAKGDITLSKIIIISTEYLLSAINVLISFFIIILSKNALDMILNCTAAEIIGELDEQVLPFLKLRKYKLQKELSDDDKNKIERKIKNAEPFLNTMIISSSIFFFIITPIIRGITYNADIQNLKQ